MNEVALYMWCYPPSSVLDKFRSSISAHSDSSKEIKSSSFGKMLTRELCSPDEIITEFVKFCLNKKGCVLEPLDG